MNLKPPAFDADPVPEGYDFGAPRRLRRSTVTSEERRRADARTVATLERNGFDVRPKTKTSLLDLESGIEHHLDETRARSLFASHARQRAADMAKAFDAYSEQVDRSTLRLFGLRPAGGKAPPGTLAQALRGLSADYNRYVGRLVSAGRLKPILSCIHIRYDHASGLYDPHIHLVGNVAAADLDAVNMELARRFADPWQEREPIREPGAVINYLLLWTFNHREVATWPEEAIVEVWTLPRVRLSRPAGAFAGFRREAKGKLFVRENGRVVVRERPAAPPCGTSRRRSFAPSDDEARVVAIRDVRIGGHQRRCAIIKRPRVSSVQEPMRPEGAPTAVVQVASARWFRRLRAALTPRCPCRRPSRASTHLPEPSRR